MKFFSCISIIIAFIDPIFHQHQLFIVFVQIIINKDRLGMNVSIQLERRHCIFTF